MKHWIQKLMLVLVMSCAFSYLIYDISGSVDTAVTMNHLPNEPYINIPVAHTEDVQTQDIVRVVLTNDNYLEPMRSSFQILYDDHVLITEQSVIEQLNGADRGCITVEPAISHSIQVMEADTGSWSSPYRGTMTVYKEGDRFWLVNHVPLEEYLLGVVPGEMPERFHMEALKAQAICARTYVYNQMSLGAYERYHADVEDSVLSQVYNKHGEHEKTSQAVLETTGMVLAASAETGASNLAETYYFSTSCGFTTGEEAWNQHGIPYLTSVSTLQSPLVSGEVQWDQFLKNQEIDAYDSGSNYFRWTAILQVPDGAEITIDKREQSGIVTKITYTENGTTHCVETESEIREFLNSYIMELRDKEGSTISMDLLPSAWFSMEKESNGTYVLYGGGYGHGIGMSQYGAHGMAEAGFKYQDILQYFYPGTRILIP